MKLSKLFRGKDSLDGCDVDFTESPLADEEIDGFVLFADIDSDDPEAVANRISELEELHGA